MRPARPAEIEILKFENRRELYTPSVPHAFSSIVTRSRQLDEPQIRPPVHLIRARGGGGGGSVNESSAGSRGGTAKLSPIEGRYAASANFDFRFTDVIQD